MPPAGRPWANALDMYRKVPTDLLEGTARGSLLSYFSLLVMLTLGYMETKAYLTTTIVTDLALDTNREPRVRVNFNVTLMDLRCDYATIDVVSVLGTDQNVTQHVTKFSLNADGVRQRFAGRNKQQNDIAMSDERVTESIEELHENGEDAVSLDAQTLEFAKNENDFLFVDFYASWCSHCRDLAPTWETLAEVMTDAAEMKVDEHMEKHNHDYSDEDYEEAVKVELPVFVAKIDCVDHAELCLREQIRGYPTLRLFHDGEHMTDYRGHREVVEMTHWLTNIENKVKAEEGDGNEEDKNEKGDVAKADELARDRMDVEETAEEMNKPPRRPSNRGGPRSPEEEDWVLKMNKHRSRQKADWNDDEHPGCQMSGFLMVDRAPGHFRIQAQSNHHDIAAHMTNVSHEIHHLSFGDPSTVRTLEQAEESSTISMLPKNFLETTHPMDGNAYVVTQVHEAHHHYLKIITTDLDHPGIEDSRYRQRDPNYGKRAYTILQSSQLSYFRNDVVPDAKFTYDLSPISVSYRTKNRHWYTYLTSLMAIMGGTFTLLGMLDSGVNAVAGKKRGF